MHSKLAAFHVSWYMSQNNSPGVDYAFFRSLKDLPNIFLLYFVVGIRRHNDFFFILRCPGMLSDHGTSKTLLMLQISNLCVVYLHPPSVMFITKASNIFSASWYSGPIYLPLIWETKCDVLFCSMPR